MKSEDIKKAVGKAKVTNPPIITGTDKKTGEPIEKKSNIYRIDLTKAMNQTVDVEAKNEKDARSKAIEAIKSQRLT